MALKVHALVKNSDDLDPIGDNAEKQDMGARRVSAITRTDIFTWAAPTRVACYELDHATDFKNIAISLSLVPMLGRIVPDLLDVRLSAN